MVRSRHCNMQTVLNFANFTSSADTEKYKHRISAHLVLPVQKFLSSEMFLNAFIEVLVNLSLKIFRFHSDS